MGVLTFFQVQYQYVVNVLCVNKNQPITQCHGKCFLNKYVSENKATDATAPPPVKPEKVALADVVMPDCFHLAQPFHGSVAYNTRAAPRYAYLLPKDFFHPPPKDALPLLAGAPPIRTAKCQQT